MKKNRPLIFAMGILILGIILVLIFQPPREKSDSQPQSPYDKLICASPSITEIVFALGFGNQVVGVSDFTMYPHEARSIVTIGGLFNPHKERITTLQPDLVITQGLHSALTSFCEDKRLPLLSVPMDSLEHIPEAIITIGKKLGATKRASKLAEQLKQDLKQLQEKTRLLPARKVFLSLGHTPGDLTGLMTTGSDTFLHELIQIAGGTNIFSDAAGRYPQISKEALVAREPDIIIEVFAEGISSENRKLLRQDWERLATLPAVKSENIHFLTEDYLLIPSPRIVLTAHRFAAIIHPEVFDDTSD